MHRVWIVAVLLASAVVAQGQHTLRYSIEPGLTYRFEQVISMEGHLDMAAGWQQMQMDQSTEQVTSGRIEVLEADDGVTTVARVTFDDRSATQVSSSMMPAAQRIPFELAGRTVIAAAQSDGSLEVTDEGGRAIPGLGTETQQVVRSVALPDPASMPDTPVAVGESWTAMLGQASDPLRPTYTLTLIAVDDQTAEVRAAGTLRGENEGMSVTLELEGTVTIDRATGLTVAAKLSGPTTSSGTSDMGDGVTATVNGKGIVTQASTITFGGTGNWEGSRIAAQVPEGWSSYSHTPSGVSFKHPADWRIQDTPQGIQIIPTEFDQARELLFGFGAPAQGETDAASPAARQNLDMILRAQAPTLMSRGAPERLEVDEGSAAIYRYAGPMPDGSPGACTVFVRILGETAVAMGIAGTEAKVAERLPELRGMFDSLTMQTQTDRAAAPDGEADTDDRRLIGMFRGEAISNNVEGIYINTQLVYAIGADGRVHYGAKSAMAASKRDYNQDLVWTASGESAGDVRSGDWSAKNGMLTVKWDNGGQSVFAYGFEPDGSLVLRNPQTRELVNFFPRVR
ncbi:MAG: DUF6263 family protein [Planctomycetota bacterium]